MLQEKARDPALSAAACLAVPNPRAAERLQSHDMRHTEGLLTCACQVANVAHGWLLKEESSGGSPQLRHFWFVLFSNGILMHFSDPNRANLGQSLGFIPVEECVESSHSSKQHTLHIKCSFDQWLLATNSKENMLQWAASLHAAQPSKTVSKPVADLILAQGWLDLPKEDDDNEEVWVRHWFVLKNSLLSLFSEDQKTREDLSQPIVLLHTSEMRSATRAKGVDFYKWGIIIETQKNTAIRLRAVGQSEMKQLLSSLNVHCIETSTDEEKVDFVKSKAIIRSGYLYKKSLKQVARSTRLPLLPTVARHRCNAHTPWVARACVRACRRVELSASARHGSVAGLCWRWRRTKARTRARSCERASSLTISPTRILVRVLRSHCTRR